MSTDPYRARDLLLAILAVSVSWLAVIGAASILLGRW